MLNQTQQAQATNHHRIPQDVLQEVRGVLKEAQAQLRPIDRWLRATVAQRPYLCVGVGTGAGLLAGIFARRRRALGVGLVLGFGLGCVASQRLLAAASER